MSFTRFRYDLAREQKYLQQSTDVGRYILNYNVFKLLDKQKKGHGNEIQPTDSLISLIENPGLYGLEFEGSRYDCGNKLGFIEANVNLVNNIDI